MALLNNFILDMLDEKDTTDRKFEIWSDETLANQQKLHNQEMLYLQNHTQPRNNYDLEATEFIEKNKELRAEYVKHKTSGSMRNWLKHYSTMPENNYSKIFTAFS
jgi:hypothetical protein